MSLTLSLPYFFLFPEEGSIPHRPQFLWKIPAHVCAPLHCCSPCQEISFSMGSPRVAAFLAAQPPAPVWGPPQAAEQSHLVPGAPPPFFTDLKCLQDVYFPLTPFTDVEQHFPPFLIYHEVLSNAIQWVQLWPVAGPSWSWLRKWLSDTGASSAAFIQKSPLQSPSYQTLATQKEYTAKAQVSAVLRSMFSFCAHCLYTMIMFYFLEYVLHL